MNNINTHIMQTSGKLKPFLTQIEEVMVNYLPRLTERLGVSDIDIVFCDDASRAIPETGVGGFAHHKHFVMIYIDPDFPNLVDNLEVQLKSTLAHELNHTLRWQKIGYKYTLLESIISEGLADHCDIILNNNNPQPWDNALSETDFQKYLSLAKNDWHNNNYNHATWFFGAGDIPRWTGYSLGFKIVGDYIKRTGKDITELTRLPAETFVDNGL